MNAILYSDPFARKTPFGTGRYARHLLHELRKQNPHGKYQPISTWSDCSPEQRQALKTTYGWRKLPWKRKITASAWAFLKYPPIEYWLGKEHNLVHVLECVYPVRTQKPLVVTIHDIGPLTHPNLFTSVRPWLMKMGLRQAIDQAESIICVSQATADSVQNYFQVDLGDQIKVIHEGINPAYLTTPDIDCLNSVQNLPPEGTPFIMTMGAISPRKNLPTVIEAMEKLADTIPHHLVHVGIPHWDADDFFSKLKSSPIAERIHLPGYLDDNQVHALYHKASAYVFPSLFEGFGLPILEAMAGNCPVITSNISSMPEIAGDAAWLIDPHDLDEMIDAIQTICLDQAVAENLRKRGQQRITSFSWEQCAAKTQSIYDQIIS